MNENRILTLVPARPGRPGIGEVFEKPSRVVERDRWVAVYYDGERIAKVKNHADAHGVIASKRAEQRAEVEAHNAKARANLAEMERIAQEAADRAAAALAQEAAALAASDTLAGASEGGDTLAGASEGGDTLAGASEGGEGGDTLTETQTESETPKAVSHVARRPSRKRK
jgi:hypothetical protein